jgi:hypothetical protein
MGDLVDILVVEREGRCGMVMLEVIVLYAIRAAKPIEVCQRMLKMLLCFVLQWQ